MWFVYYVLGPLLGVGLCFALWRWFRYGSLRIQRSRGEVILSDNRIRVPNDKCEWVVHPDDRVKGFRVFTGKSQIEVSLTLAPDYYIAKTYYCGGYMYFDLSSPIFITNRIRVIFHCSCIAITPATVVVDTRISERYTGETHRIPS